MVGAFPEWLDGHEKRIIGAMIDKALAKGWRISVFDGEETTLSRSDDRAQIQANVGQTDMTSLTFWTAELERLGAVMLVHGNGEDVISDCTDRQEILDLIDEVTP